MITNVPRDNKEIFLFEITSCEVIPLLALSHYTWFRTKDCTNILEKSLIPTKKHAHDLVNPSPEASPGKLFRITDYGKIDNLVQSR